MWLSPNRQRLSLRVTTTLEADVPVDSFTDIPLHKWTLLTFVFNNYSALLENNATANNVDQPVGESISNKEIVSDIVVTSKKANNLPNYEIFFYHDDVLDLQ